MALRIFVIDREESIRDSFQLYLEEQGHEVLTASEPASCQVYQGHNCTKDYPCGQVLFIGYHLAEMNGLDFIEMMEKRGCRGMVRNKVLMSGNTSVIDMDKANRLGCKVLQKPVSLKDINKIVEEVEMNLPEDERLMVVNGN